MSRYFAEDEDYAGRLDLALWRRIAAHARPYRPQLVGLGLNGLLIAAVDSAFPMIVGLVIDEATTNGATTRLLTYGGVYGAGIVAFCFSVWLFIVLAGQVATGVAYDLRTAGFARLQALSFSFFDVRPVGWLVTRLTSDCAKVSSLLPWLALDLVWGTSSVLFIIGAMLWLNWKLALIVMLIVPPLVLASWFFQTRLLASSRLMRKTNSEMTASFNECLMGVRTTKALVREAANLGEFQMMSSAMHRYSIRNALQSAVYLPLVITIGSAGVGLALWRGGVLVGGVTVGGSTVSLGTLVAFMQYATLFYMPIQELARRFTELQAAQAAAERVQGLLDTEPEIRDAPGVADAPIDGAIETLEFRNVTFWYKEGEAVLRSFDLTVHAGETIALVGPTGGGKSTIVALAARFYEPREGAILVNGADYRTRPLHWLQSNLGVVQQAPHLFSGSIRDNIRYGRLDATDADIEAAARLTGAHPFIAGFEDGYDSEVGEGGSQLSTGQRQLVSLARAVLADPQIFIMDEATSSVDTETEQVIQGAIEAVLRGRIAFVIAHRLSTIRSADRILVIAGGRIVEQGPHDALMKKRGTYHGLYMQQFARQREAEVLSQG